MSEVHDIFSARPPGGSRRTTNRPRGAAPSWRIPDVQRASTPSNLRLSLHSNRTKGSGLAWNASISGISTMGGKYWLTTSFTTRSSAGEPSSARSMICSIATSGIQKQRTLLLMVILANQTLVAFCNVPHRCWQTSQNQEGK